MKKNLLLSFVLLFCIYTNAKNEIKYEKDPFNGLESFELKYENISSGLKPLKLKLVKFILEKDTSYSVHIMIKAEYLCCFGRKSKILIKSGEEVVEIQLSGNIECKSAGESMLDYAAISEENRRFLKTYQIDMIRLYFTEGYVDYVINKPDYFIKSIKMLE